MPKIRVHPITTELLLEGIGVMYTYNGTPINSRALADLAGKPISEWEVAGEVESLWAWQDLDTELPSRLRCHGVMVVHPPNVEYFIAGGSILHAQNYVRECRGKLEIRSVYASRQAARDYARSHNGAEW